MLSYEYMKNLTIITPSSPDYFNDITIFCKCNKCCLKRGLKNKLKNKKYYAFMKKKKSFL